MKKLALLLALSVGTSLLALASPSVTINWVASTSTGVTGYNVYRAPCSSTSTLTNGTCPTANEGTFAQVNTAVVTGTTYTDTTTAAGNVYSYYLTSVCPTCSPTQSVPSAHVAANTYNPQPAPPTAPTIGTITAQLTRHGKEEVTAKWTAARGTETTYTLTGANGKVLASGSEGSSNGTYSLTWEGAAQRSVTLKVCDISGCATKSAGGQRWQS